jgi:hypothetical protein
VYWFEKARAAIEAGTLKRAGLVATNSIRGGKNREVLDRVVKTTRLFEAWSDEPWVNDGAAVRVSLVAFGDSPQAPHLDGGAVREVYPDLSAPATGESSLDLGAALPVNRSGTAFIGTQKGGPFDVPAALARTWLTQPNPHGASNADVLAPWINGLDITRRPQEMWLIDFEARDAASAALYEAPWTHCESHVRPARMGNREARTGSAWWLLQRARPEFNGAVRALTRYIATARVAKHRLFAFAPASVIPDSQVVAFTRADDTTFGILHSRLHELWSLRLGTSLEDRPRYTPTTCFETFPFPAGLTPADTAHQRTEQPLEGGALIPAGLADAVRAHAEAIARAAQRLAALREAWLNPPEWCERVPEVVPLGLARSPYPDRIVAKPGFEKELAQRTLTALYNQRPAWLAQAHATLDAAVAAAYGFTDWSASMSDDEILRRLLALNRERSAMAGATDRP